MRVLETMENPRHYGAITCLCIDRKRVWLVAGTATGVLTLWDLRFGMLVKSWRVGASSAEIAKSSRIYQIVLHPTRGKGRWIMVAFETTRQVAGGVDSSPTTTLIEVWDIEKTSLMETYATREIVAGGSSVNEELPPPAEVTGDPTEVNPATAIAALVRSRQQQSRTPLDRFPKRPAQGGSPGDPPLVRPSLDVRTMVVGSDLGGHPSKFEPGSPADGRTSGGRGFMLSGSDDRKLRLWDLARVERSAVLSGAEMEAEKPGYR